MWQILVQLHVWFISEYNSERIIKSVHICQSYPNKNLHIFYGSECMHITDRGNNSFQLKPQATTNSHRWHTQTVNTGLYDIHVLTTRRTK